jgi:PAS domain S-box-containing protein
MTAIAAEQILQQTPDALILVGRGGDIVFANAAVGLLFGYEPRELIDRSIETLIPERYRDAHQRYRQEFNDEPANREMGARVVALSALRKDGSEFPVEIRLAPVNIEGNMHIVAAVRDVTDRRRMTEELRKARAEADKANRTKSRFLATASHDLRQPLQALQLLNAELGRRITGPDDAELIDRQQAALDSMSDLLNALLDITRLESGMLNPVIEDIPIAGVVADLQRQLQDLAAARELALTLECCPGTIRTDRVLFRQMLQNLLNNAVQYTLEGEVSLRIRRSESHLVLEVSDTGMGIPPEQLERIFEEYYRIDRPDIARPGFGLGLTIVNQIAHLLHYELNVESQVGQGSTFRVLIPLTDLVDISPTGDAPAPSDSDASELLRPSILIVEDDAPVRDALALVLRSAGYPVMVAATAAEALALFAERGATIDFVITDFALGNSMNGVQLLQELRAVAKRDLPALILSGDVSGLVETVGPLSRVGLLRKPVGGKRLIQSIEGLFGAADPNG